MNTVIDNLNIFCIKYRTEKYCILASNFIHSRLTGAGWGGCIVALLSSDKVGSFLDGMKKDYYQDLAAAKTDGNSSAYMFPSQPGSGAKIYQVEG